MTSACGRVAGVGAGVKEGGAQGTPQLLRAVVFLEQRGLLPISLAWMSSLET